MFDFAVRGLLMAFVYSCCKCILRTGSHVTLFFFSPTLLFEQWMWTWLYPGYRGVMYTQCTDDADRQGSRAQGDRQRFPREFAKELFI